MIGWLIFAAWLVVSAFVGRALLRIVMTRPVCTLCGEGWFTGKCFSDFKHTDWDGKPKKGYRRVPLGELMERPMAIGLAAAVAGLAWPLTGLVAVVMHAPRTSGELARRNTEMTETIHQLEEQLRRSGGAS